MSGRFAGSKSVDDRRRRRLAAEESQPAVVAADSTEKPLPARRPTARFPLQRLVSRSPWKLAGVGGLTVLLSGAALASGYLPPVTAGAYGPGVAAWCSAETGRLPTVVSALLLLASGQVAWLIRWARARSLRDFRGSYRVWWWAAFALFLGGFSQLTAAHEAVAATAVWLTGRTPLGSDTVFRLLPACAALIVLLPALQRDMRDCRTSRSLLLLAAALWMTGGGMQLMPKVVDRAMLQLTVTIPFAALTTGLLLAGAASLFTAFLFHARHVVYESVEPPVLPARRTRPVTEDVAEASDAEVDQKPKRTTSRRSSRAKAAASASSPTEAGVEPQTVTPKTAVKPATVVKAEPQPRSEPKVEPKVETRAAAARQETAPQPAPVASKPAPSRPAPVEEEDWSSDEEMASDGDGRQYRLDEAQDSLKGLSKRERRKQRKAMKDRDRMGM